MMHLEVQPVRGPNFSCIFIYGSSFKHERTSKFQQLENLATQCSGPWIILGDFNCITNFNEQIGQPVKLSKIAPLRSCMNI